MSKKEEPVTPRVVRATGAAASKAGLGKALEDAMVAAIEQAAADGIGVDKPDELRERMRIARERAKDAFNGVVRA